jgi:exosortase
LPVTTSAFERQEPIRLPSSSIARVALASTALSFAVLFAQPFASTTGTWWNDPEAGHGLLLAPLAFFLAWRRGLHPASAPGHALGLTILAVAVALRYIAALAADPFLSRSAMFLALAALVIYAWGARQVLAWWLPASLLALSVPLPDAILGSLALPLQLKASSLGATLLSWRGLPVHLDGNVIRLPGHDLFVTEACSGLRSLTALLSSGVLLGGLLLRSPWGRMAIIVLAIPVAVIVNGVRVFITGFLVAFVDPALAEGFTHVTEGWLLFLVAFAILGSITYGVVAIERRLTRVIADA